MKVDIRLKGLAKPSDGANKELLENRTGYKLVRDGDDWIIPKDDPALLAGPSDYLTIRKPLSLADDLESVADECVKSLCDTYENVRSAPPARIPVFSQFGLSSAFYKECLEYGFMPRSGIKQYLINTLFPYMKREFAAQHVVPVFIRADKFQSAISLSKLSYLMSEFDSVKVQKLVDSERGLDSIIPSPAHVIGYFDAFMIVSPSVVAIPLDRAGSALYFVQDKVWMFPYVATTNLLEKMQMGLDPMVSGRPQAIFEEVLSGPAIRKYLTVVGEALNSTLKMLSDPRTFLEPDGVMNFKKQFYTQSGIRLILHEVAEVGASGSSYVRQRLAFNVIDKFANLRHAMHKRTSENDAFDEVFSENFRDSVISIYRSHLGTALANQFIRLTHSIYQPILTKKNGGVRRPTEIRGLRNLNHGVFLGREQFSTVFIDGEGAMPYEFAYLPYLLGLALVLNPKKLLGMVN